MEMELQAYLVQFFAQFFLMRWETKRKMGNKKKKKLRKLSQLHAFSFFKCIFKKFVTTAKATCLRIKVAQLNTLSVGKEITGIPSRPTVVPFF